MKALQYAAAVFCIACIGTELVTLLVGSCRAARCIKAAAGLYILTVLFSLLPGLPAKLTTAAQPPAPVQPDSFWEQTQTRILADAGTQLEEHCIAACQQRFGVEIRLGLTLDAAEQGTGIQKAQVEFPAGYSADTKRAVLDYLQQELGVLPTEAKGAMQP